MVKRLDLEEILIYINNLLKWRTHGCTTHKYRDPIFTGDPKRKPWIIEV